MRRLILLLIALLHHSLYAISANSWFFEKNDCSVALLKVEREAVYEKRAVDLGITEREQIAEFVDRSVKRKVLLIAMDDAQYELSTLKSMTSTGGVWNPSSMIEVYQLLFSAVGEDGASFETEAPLLASLLHGRTEITVDQRRQIHFILLFNFIAAAARHLFFDALLVEDLSVPAEKLPQEWLISEYQSAFSHCYTRAGLPPYSLPKSEKKEWQEMVEKVLNSSKLPRAVRKMLWDQIDFAKAYHVTEQLPESVLIALIAKYFEIEI